MPALDVTDQNFEQEVTNADLPVLADFWAEWCGPCKVIGPIVNEIADELSDKLKVVKINVDDAQELAGKFQIMSIPTLLLFKGGEVVDTIVGAVPKEQILEKVNKHA